ncbi:unnamed protein product [Brachionus calyciflorus]|uniref:Swi5-dependent recombination DNA repair protein 1 homolog n=1 Tax=Brachionus calyciflorus TaxID=104777 RepID=A0A814DVE8_9BILA|nr:unnamed protein product [Brachionus calyciflorus]
MPFLSKNSKRKLILTEPKIDHSKLEESSEKETQNLEKILDEKKETLRRLNLVKSYKSRKDIQDLDELIKKWTRASQKAIEELYLAYLNNFESVQSDNSKQYTLLEFIEYLKIDPKLVKYDVDIECFIKQD